MKTIQDILDAEYPHKKGESVEVYFDSLKKEDKVFQKGDFKMTATLQKEALVLADLVIEAAKKQGVDINTLPEVKEAKGFDKDADTLTREELAALIVGKIVANDFEKRKSTNTLVFTSGNGLRAQIQDTIDGKHNTVKLGTLNLEIQELGNKLAGQLYGDTYRDSSSIDTTTSESLAPLNNAAGKAGVSSERC